MVAPQVRTEIERAALRAAGLQRLADEVSAPSASDEEICEARRRAEDARIRARQAALRAAVSLEKSARLRQRVARLAIGEGGGSAAGAFTADS
jgi:hypothetical protein